MISTAVGYTGGTAPNPSYNSVCRGDGHTEAIQVEFDPAQVSYEELMRRVVGQATLGGKPQYQSAVWAADAEQAACAKKLAAEMGKGGLPVMPAAAFHLAEEYHQKYYEKASRR